jgi:hypothetical protein
MKVKVTNVDDSTDFKVMTFMTRKATGNEELVKDEDKNNLYPNPSTGLTKLQLVSSTRGETLIELIDLSGSVIKSEMANIEVGINEIQLNYSNLEKGVYFIRYQNGNVTETKKFTLR